jgi:hypothetical protein
MVEREQALAVHVAVVPPQAVPPKRSRLGPFLLGMLAGAAVLFAVALIASLRG